jgi:hypothetical protein
MYVGMYVCTYYVLQRLRSSWWPKTALEYDHLSFVQYNPITKHFLTAIAQVSMLYVNQVTCVGENALVHYITACVQIHNPNLTSAQTQ